MKKGFTLIEMVVVVGVFGLLMAVVVGVLVNSFKAKNRVDLTSLIEENGRFVQAELRKNLLLARANSLVCPVGVGTSVGFENNKDGQLTVIICDSAGIASESASPVDLTGTSVTVDCSNFVSCSAGNSPIVNFNFTLSAGVVGGGAQSFASRKFEQGVVVRN